jgi:HSP20 family protein
MANVTINKTAASPAPTMTRWDPFSAFRDFMRWDPFREIAPLSSMERFNEFDAPFEVKETKEGYLFKADVPGIKEDDITINLHGNRLSVSGKREEEKKHESETYFSYERSYGTFTRSFTLPEGIDGDKVQANLKDGVLSILVPKRPESLPKKVAIKTG